MRISFVIFLLSVIILAPLTPVLAASDAIGPIFQMANGHYYHPGSGKTAFTKEGLLRELGHAPQVSPNPHPSESPSFDLKNAITRAQRLLEEYLKNNPTPKIAVPVSSLEKTWLPVTLAIWQPGTDRITIRNLLRRQKDLQNIDGTSVGDIKVIRSNGVSSEYEVLSPTGAIVVANIHPIVNRNRPDVYDLESVIYIPYSDEVHTEQMIRYGKEYIDQIVDRMYAELRVKQIPSLKFPDRLLADVIDPHLVKAIAVIEHTDTWDMNTNPARAIQAFFVKLAANEEDAYIYARSSAGALGLVQFIPKTYVWVVKKRPSLNLAADFEQGMRNPENAIKAQIAYLDILLTEMPELASATFDAERERVYEYLVAAYNGGSGNVRKAMPQWERVIHGERAALLSDLAKRHAIVDRRIEELKSTIKSMKDPSSLKALKIELAGVQKEHDEIVVQEARYKKSVLKEETRLYVLKYRKASSMLDEMETVLQLASDTQEFK